MDRISQFDTSKFTDKVDLEYVKDHGRVERIGDGIVFCSGLDSIKMHEVVMINNEYRGIVLDLSEGLVGLGLFEETTKIFEGMEAVSTKKLFSLSAGNEQLGAIINTLGERIDGGEAFNSAVEIPAFNLAPPIMKITDVHRPLMTGQLIIDAITPIGKGQRQLILGNRQTGKTQIGIETILNQKGKDVYCVYVAIGQKMAYIADVAQTLREMGAMTYTTIVAATASQSLTMQYLAPYAAMGLAEYWRDEGKDVLIVFDDLSKHANVYRAITLLFKRPPGREAYPGDIFYIHSSLLERAVQLKECDGGGSITALPLVELLSDDLTAYVPTNIISITDGQLFLKSDLFNSGQKPAISVAESVSRVGSNAQFPIIKKYSQNLMLILSQYFELKEFLTFDNSLSPENLRLIHNGEILLELCKQEVHAGYSLTQATFILYAFQKERLVNIPVQQITDFKNIMTEKLIQRPNYLSYENELQTAKDLNEAMKNDFDLVIEETMEVFVCLD